MHYGKSSANHHKCQSTIPGKFTWEFQFGGLVLIAYYIFGSKKKNIRQHKRKTYRHLIECSHQQDDSSIYKTIIIVSNIDCFINNQTKC